jgi:hypothetical protein
MQTDYFNQGLPSFTSWILLFIVWNLLLSISQLLSSYINWEIFINQEDFGSQKADNNWRVSSFTSWTLNVDFYGNPIYNLNQINVQIGGIHIVDWMYLVQIWEIHIVDWIYLIRFWLLQLRFIFE